MSTLIYKLLITHNTRSYYECFGRREYLARVKNLDGFGLGSS